MRTRRPQARFIHSSAPETQGQSGPLSASTGRLRLSACIAGLAGLSGAAALHPQTAFAIIAESQFDRTQDDKAAQILATGGAYFVPKRIMRTTSQRSHEVFDLQGQESLRIDTDSFDGSTVLRRGDLGLDLSRLSAGRAGQSLQERLQSNLPDNERNDIERIIAQSILTRLRDNPLLAVKGGQLALDRSRTLLSADFVSLSFSLYVQGRRVEGTEITARFKDGAWVSLVTDTFGAAEGRARLLPAARSPKMSFESTAKAKLGPAFAKISDREPVWIPSRGASGYELIPAVQGTLTDTSGQTYTLTLSEAEGANGDTQVLEYFAHRYNFAGRISGTYYQRHPETPTVSSGLPYITVKNGGLFGRKSFTADKQGNLKVPRQESVLLKLASPYVVIANNSGKDAQITATGDAAFEPGENATHAEVTTYFHTNLINEYVRERIPQKLPWLDKQLRATVNLSSVCNAFYNGTINFFNAGATKRRNGEEISCNNTGEIADVVYHEWGHGLDDNTGGIDDGAFSEAIGDITSMLITNSPEVGPYFISDGSPVRNLDDEYQYPPKDNEREVHVEGLIFGSTWYHLTQALIEKYRADVGRDTSARLFLKLLYTASRYTDAYEALQDIDSTRGAKGPNYCLINTAFARHGLATADSSCKG